MSEVSNKLNVGCGVICGTIRKVQSYSKDGIFSCVLDDNAIYLGVDSEGDLSIKKAIGTVVDGSLVKSEFHQDILGLLKKGYRVDILDGSSGTCYKVDVVKSLLRDEESLKITKSNLETNYGFMGGMFFRIHSISDAGMVRLLEDVLFLRSNVSQCQTKYGSVLLNERDKGKIYIDGVYEISYPMFDYGWNLKFLGSNSNKETDVYKNINSIYNSLSKGIKDRLGSCYEVVRSLSKEGISDE